MGSLRRLARRAREPVLGLVLLSAIGSCELPKPNIPKIGVTTPASPTAQGSVAALAPVAALGSVGAHPRS